MAKPQKEYGKKKKPVVTCTFDESGDPTFEGDGFEGNECIHEMGPLEEALGLVGRRTATADMRKKKKAVQKERERS